MSDLNFDASNPVTTSQSVADLRVNYDLDELLETQLASSPLDQFSQWLNAAIALGRDELIEPNAMVLTTRGADDLSSRTVLLKGVDERGLIFYTNYTSRKAQDIASNPNVTAVFPWYPLHRQVIVNGVASHITREESEIYFASRPYKSKLGAMVSNQSREIESRHVLEQRMAELEDAYPEGSDIPMPDYWGGYVITVRTIEFWQGRRSRLHDRLRFIAQDDNSLFSNPAHWQVVRLSP